jgi:hypothetical protein
MLSPEVKGRFYRSTALKLSQNLEVRPPLSRSWVHREITETLPITFAWTRSLIPSNIAHAIINVPMTPVWQGALLVVFVIGAFFAWLGDVRAIKQVFTNTTVTACAVLAVVETAYVIAAGRIGSMTYVAIGMVLIAVALEAIDRLRTGASVKAPASRVPCGRLSRRS